jgi:hypothetical protein
LEDERGGGERKGGWENIDGPHRVKRMVIVKGMLWGNIGKLYDGTKGGISVRNGTGTDEKDIFLDFQDGSMVMTKEVGLNFIFFHHLPK